MGILGNFLGLMLGQAAIERYAEYRKRRGELLKDFGELVDRELTLQQPEQDKYEKFLAETPALKRSENRKTHLDVTYADLEMLENFHLYLESKGLKGSGVVALLTANPIGRNVSVEISEAYISTINGDFGSNLCKLAELHGNYLKCEAVISESRGEFQVDLLIDPSDTSLDEDAGQ